MHRLAGREERRAPLGRGRLALLLGVIVTLTVGLFGVRELGLFGNPGCGLPIVTCTRVLFIGNSYTYVNDLPATFANLAWSGGYRVDTRTLASGGGTLAAHAADPETASVISSEPWSTVVLQDQSQNPASASYRASEMYPAATDLVALIRNAGARPMFFLTWGHRSGWPEAGLPGYTSMQAAVDQGYLGNRRAVDGSRGSCRRRLAGGDLGSGRSRTLAAGWVAPDGQRDVPCGVCLFRRHLPPDSGGAQLPQRSLDIRGRDVATGRCQHRAGRPPHLGIALTTTGRITDGLRHLHDCSMR
jgi:hypothetical protein